MLHVSEIAASSLRTAVAEAEGKAIRVYIAGYG